RHTISKRDWSSDVCSSDLVEPKPGGRRYCGWFYDWFAVVDARWLDVGTIPDGRSWPLYLFFCHSTRCRGSRYARCLGCARSSGRPSGLAAAEHKAAPSSLKSYIVRALDGT